MESQLCIQEQNSYLIWDYKTGEVIDLRTGEVIGQIYDVDAPQLFCSREHRDDTSTTAVNHGYKPRPSRKYYRLLRKHREVLRLQKDGFSVRDGYYEGKPRSIISSASSLVLDRLRDDSISAIVERGKRILRRHKYYELIISGRTERFIVILSYILGKREIGESISKRELKTLFNISDRMYRDVKRVLDFFFGVRI